MKRYKPLYWFIAFLLELVIGIIINYSDITIQTHINYSKSKYWGMYEKNQMEGSRVGRYDHAYTQCAIIYT